MKIVFRTLALCLFTLLGSTLAQPLATLAPDDAVLSLSWSLQDDVYDTLKEDLAALDWGQGVQTLEKALNVAAKLGEDIDVDDFADIYEQMRTYSDPATAFGAFAEICPGFEAVANEAEAYHEAQGGFAPFDALLTVSVNAFSPVPAVTALLRVDETAVPLYEQIQAALLECAATEGDAEVTELEQNGTPFYVVGDAGDFPVIAGNQGTLFFLGSNPEVIRSVLRRAGGSGEASLADTSLYARTPSTMMEGGNSVGLALDFAALADVADNFSGMVASEPATAYLAERATGLLRTLGGVQAQLSITDEGLVSESFVALDPAGGDAALLELFRCTSCRVSAPLLAPEGTVAVSAQHLPWREVWIYAQDWLSGLEEVTGETVDPAGLLESFGLDPALARFDWLGSEVQTYTLEPFSTDLRTLLYNPAQVTLIPVSSPEAARAALSELGRVLGPLFEGLLAETAGGSMTDELFGMSMLYDEIAVSDYVYKDVLITRLRASINADIGYAFVGNYLMVGAPTDALETVINTFSGGSGLGFETTYRQFRSQLPEQVASYAYSDLEANLRGVSDLLDIFVQPAAFGVRAGLSALLEETGSSSDYLDYSDEIDLGSVTPATLNAPGTLEGNLSETDTDAYGYVTGYIELSDLTPGDRVDITLESAAFETYLSLLDAEAAIYLDDYSSDTSDDETFRSELSFEVEEGRRYWLEVSSYDGSAVGDYSVTVEVEAGIAAEALTAEDLPSFADLLALFDLLPQSVDVLADHISTAEGYSEVRDDALYQRSIINIRW